MKTILIAVLQLAILITSIAQTFEGIITDATSGDPLEGVVVKLLGEDSTTTTNASGAFTIIASDTDEDTITLELDGYMFEQFIDLAPQTGLNLEMREKVASTASLRMDNYEIHGCSVTPPDDPDWNVTFVQSDLTGDLAPNNTYTRRDPSAVIEVEGIYYVWYSYSLTHDATKIAPWDRNDLYYATSSDGYNWIEQGIAVGRGTAGSFDARSVFTTEIFVHENIYYLVYQAASTEDGVYNRNTVGMAYASSPNGPWTKLNEPVLRPSLTNSLLFDNNAVHDPCILYYNNKFHLYYKGECNCMEAAGCVRWCNPSCGLSKQVKWGVAIADSPTGPYVKSEFNPITNTGHEVSVWNYDGGVAILQHQDGPEANTIQYANDGLNFEIMGSISGFPEAPGLFRPNAAITAPTRGVSWGLCHVLNFTAGPHGWMNLRRFDLLNIPVTDINIVKDTLYIENGTIQRASLTITPANATNTLIDWVSDNTDIASVDDEGLITGEALGTTKVRATSNDGGFADSVIVVVQVDPVIVTQIVIEAEDFISTGGTVNDAIWGGPGLGVNATSSGINFVNNDDWATYSLSVGSGGVYSVTYYISCPTNEAEITCYIDDAVISVDEVVNNGIPDGWDNYVPLKASSTYNIGGGIHALKIESSGSQTWSWNLDKIVLTKIVRGITVTPESLTLGIVGTSSLSATIDPNDAWDTSVSWSSEDNSIATVSTAGEVSAISAGTTNIIATTTDGSYTDTCTVTVNHGVKLNQYSNPAISIYPNPGTNSINIHGVPTGLYNVRIINLQGINHFNQQLYLESGSSISINSLPAGTYFIKIENEEMNNTLLFRKLTQL